MTKVIMTAAMAGALLANAVRAADAPTPSKPNIVYILCDDLGIGDVHTFNPTRGKIKTPNMDRLATEGMSFTDEHSGSAVCTPTRYGILTGRYSWRTHLQSGVLGGPGEPLIAKTQMTVPEMLKKQGYVTGMIGKWHLGMDWAQDNKTLVTKLGDKAWVAPMKDNPVNHGFDYFFGIAASLDMPPFIYIENDKFTEVPTVEKKWGRNGPAAADFEAVNVVPDFTKKAVAYLNQHAADGKTGKQPFFLYLALPSPHTPIVPDKDFEGKSGLTPYADYVMETDWAIGQVLAEMDKDGLAPNTLVIFTSDNGCSPAAKPEDLEKLGHYPSAQFRGFKADIWDGGHRIPFIARWPGKVKPGSSSTEIGCLTDLMATTAEITGFKLPDDAAEDSVSMLPALLGTDTSPLREAVVHHSIDGCFAIRKGKWKLELAAGSGGWAAPREWQALQEKLPPLQLYDMETDEAETKNVAADHPEVVKELTALLEKYVADGRSTPGPNEKNDAKINLHKVPKPPKTGAATQPRDD